ncbi:MAG: hypothetical protein U9N83_12095 [Thermodesulfobacteriota bacterium]|nr:hypothetical protein [Thermodesulfobacteriota bacterium]
MEQLPKLGKTLEKTANTFDTPASAPHYRVPESTRCNYVIIDLEDRIIFFEILVQYR